MFRLLHDYLWESWSFLLISEEELWDQKMHDARILYKTFHSFFLASLMQDWVYSFQCFGASLLKHNIFVKLLSMNNGKKENENQSTAPESSKELEKVLWAGVTSSLRNLAFFLEAKRSTFAWFRIWCIIYRFRIALTDPFSW